VDVREGGSERARGAGRRERGREEQAASTNQQRPHGRT
jgi:hypothetical protein